MSDNLKDDPVVDDANAALMDPDFSPTMAGAGVRRVNKVPLYMLGAGLGVFSIIIAMVASDRSAQQHKPQERAAEAPAKGDGKQGGGTTMYAAAVVGDKAGASGVLPPTAPPVEAPGAGGLTVPIAKPTDLDTPPRPPEDMALKPPSASEERLRPTSASSKEGDELARRIKTAKLQQLEEAVKAKTNIPVAMSRGPSAAAAAAGGRGGMGGTQRDRDLAALNDIRASKEEALRAGGADAGATFQKTMSMLQSSGLLGGASGAAPRVPASGSAGGVQKVSYSEFDGGTVGDDRWRLDQEVQNPRTKWEIRTGFVLPATMISGINSELPGPIFAQVSQNVYDTATGKYVLIPQGTRLVGAYSNQVAYGQSRVLVAWQRLVFPDGKALDLGAMPGADVGGYAGLNDQVNNHYVRIFGSAFLMSAITGGITYSQRQSQNANNPADASTVMSEALGQQLGQVTAQLISKNLNIAPTLEIRPGYRLNVVVTKDLTFRKPYHGFDY